MIWKKKKQQVKEDNDDKNKKVDKSWGGGDGTVEVAEPEGLNAKLDHMSQRIDMMSKVDKFKKDKQFKIPYGIRRQFKTLAKKSRLLVFLLKSNRNIVPTITEVKNDMIIVDGKLHNCSLDFVFLWKGKYPAIVLPEWDLNAIGTKDYYDARAGKRSSDAQDVIIKMLEANAKALPTKINTKMWIFIVVGALVVGYVLFSGGAK